MPFSSGKSLRTLSWGIGIAVGFVLFVVISRYQTSPTHIEDTLRNILQKKEILSQLRTHLLQSVEMEKNAVMAQTDAESQKFADQSLAFSAAVEENLKQLHSLVDAAPLQDETKLAGEFDKCWTEFRKLDQVILDFAVQNSNLKATSLSRERGAEAMQRLEKALDAVIRWYSGTPDEIRVTTLSYRAMTASLKIFTLHSPHIAEASNERMDQIEVRINVEKKVATKSLDELAAITGKEPLDGLLRAKAAFAEFMKVTDKVITLSRQNSNVKSLELSLGRKRTVAAQCDEILAAFQKTVHDRTFKATK